MHYWGINDEHTFPLHPDTHTHTQSDLGKPLREGGEIVSSFMMPPGNAYHSTYTCKDITSLYSSALKEKSHCMVDQMYQGGWAQGRVQTASWGRAVTLFSGSFVHLPRFYTFQVTSLSFLGKSHLSVTCVTISALPYAKRLD